MPAAQTLRVVDIAMPVVGVVVGKHRIVTVAAVIVVARVEIMATVWAKIVVVAPVVVAPARIDEQMHEQVREVDHDAGRVAVTAAQVGGAREPNRREHDASSPEGTVPVTVDEDRASRRPNVMSGNPDPVLAKSVPVAGPPGITVVLVAPIAADPVVPGRRSWAIRTGLQAFRRIRQVLDFFGLDRRPESGDPLIASVHLGPVSGHPASPFRRRSPDAADIDEILTLLVPRPIAWDPGHILFGRLGFRRKFFDRLGRLLGHDGRGLRIQLDRFREGLVQGAAKQGFDIVPVGRHRRRIRLGGRTACSGGDEQARHHKGGAQQQTGATTAYHEVPLPLGIRPP